ncbi:hypothetical protein M9H77_12496 [Catharanthus roseus]|uniref:Uncharacterized protein n=1 Tax=Catharanthus roseus TaxID=4058 RepID=A0ACC0BHQ7_CATRO|nr:hypothetical protein M9H77_12496 [Catharanthus roseus]
MVTEEFSFPAIGVDDISQLANTPSLWRISSQIKSNFYEFDGNGRGKICRRSFGGIVDHGWVEEEEESSMDLLWEDFNDENYCCEEESCVENKSLSESCGCAAEFEENESQVRCGTAKALKVSKANGGLVSAKKQKVALVMKVVKKLLLLRKIARLHKREKGFVTIEFH